MPSAQQAYYNFASGSVAVVTTAETVIGTSKSVSSSYAGCIFAVEFFADFLTGASVTGLIYRIRRDSVTGTAIVTTPTIASAASAQLPRLSLAATDSPVGEVASALYVLTVAQVAATGNGSATNVFGRVTVAE